MKLRIWDFAVAPEGGPRARKPRRPSVAAILREAYRCHGGDRHTRRAVKRWLR